MPMFVVLGNLTDEGVRGLADGGTLAATDIRENAERLGIKIHGWYMTQGPHDFVVIVEAPDEKTMLRQNMFAARQGRSRSITMRAFTRDEVRELISNQ